MAPFPHAGYPHGHCMLGRACHLQNRLIIVWICMFWRWKLGWKCWLKLCETWETGKWQIWWKWDAVLLILLKIRLKVTRDVNSDRTRGHINLRWDMVEYPEKHLPIPAYRFRMGSKLSADLCRRRAKISQPMSILYGWIVLWLHPQSLSESLWLVSKRLCPQKSFVSTQAQPNAGHQNLSCSFLFYLDLRSY